MVQQPPTPSAGKTLVTTAAGDVRAFSDGVSKFIVAHPKSAAIAALLIGLVGGHLL